AKNFECVPPSAVQDVGKTQEEAGPDSPHLVAGALGIVHAFPAMRESERGLTQDPTGDNAVLLRAKKRPKLLRLARQLDDSVDPGSARARAPHQAQREATPGGEGEARAHPDSIGTKGQISLGEV